jgi:hypothetical protein
MHTRSGDRLVISYGPCFDIRHGQGQGQGQERTFSSHLGRYQICDSHSSKMLTIERLLRGRSHRNFERSLVQRLEFEELNSTLLCILYGYTLTL